MPAKHNRYCHWYLWSDSGRFSDSVCLLSDRIGRKPLIVGGLAVFPPVALSLRSLTPSGELFWVGATRLRCDCRCRYGAAFRSHGEQNRTKAMAFIGVSFGITFPLRWCLARSSLTNLGCTRCSDDRYSGNDRHCVDHLGCAQRSTHVLNRESGMVKGSFSKVWRNRGC